MTFWQIPRCWPDEAVAVLGGGPSLDQAQVDACRDKYRIVALNRAYQMAPWADVLFGPEAGKFWRWCPDALDFAGVKIVLRGRRGRDLLPALAGRGVKVLRHSLEPGLSLDPGECRGAHAAAHVLSIIHHTGARRVRLLGVGTEPGHWHEPWPDGDRGPHVLQLRMVELRRMAAELASLGIAVEFAHGEQIA